MVLTVRELQKRRRARGRRAWRSKPAVVSKQKCPSVSLSCQNKFVGAVQCRVDGWETDSVASEIMKKSAKQHKKHPLLITAVVT